MQEINEEYYKREIEILSNEMKRIYKSGTLTENKIKYLNNYDYKENKKEGEEYSNQHKVGEAIKKHIKDYNKNIKNPIEIIKDKIEKCKNILNYGFDINSVDMGIESEFFKK